MSSRWFSRNRKLLQSRFGFQRAFRSEAALEALAKASEERVPDAVLYNYPSFSGAYSALFAHLFHSRLDLPCLILPFSSVAPFRCYLLDFLGPEGFAVELSKRSACEIVSFDHRKSAISKTFPEHDSFPQIKAYVDTRTSSSKATYKYFTKKLREIKRPEATLGLLSLEDQTRVETVLEHIEDIDLRQWRLPDTKAFSIGLKEWWTKINCVTNPHIFQQLLEINPVDLISSGSSYVSSRQTAAEKLLKTAFKVRLGRGFYGDCLGVRADGNHHLKDELGKQLSIKSAAAGLRPIGAVVFMQRKKLKMCLRSSDGITDTSEVAKAYGGGGSPSSSSFIIRMDEFNQWRSVHA